MYDLMIIDIQMPDISGIKVAQAVRAMASEIAVTPMIALTAQSFPREREKALAGGFDAFLSKPIRANELISCVSAIASQTKMQRHEDQWSKGLEWNWTKAPIADLLDAIGPEAMPASSAGLSATCLKASNS